MRKNYDDFLQLKPKDMSKTISDVTYTFINPETQKPTVVPPAHYEKFLEKIHEQALDEVTKNKFLTIMYESLKKLKSEDEKYFIQALMCLDMNLKPNDLRINEQIALGLTYENIEKRKGLEKKNFHILDSQVLDYFENVKSNPEIQADVIRSSEEYEEEMDNDLDEEMDYCGY